MTAWPSSDQPSSRLRHSMAGLCWLSVGADRWRLSLSSSALRAELARPRLPTKPGQSTPPSRSQSTFAKKPRKLLWVMFSMTEPHPWPLGRGAWPGPLAASPPRGESASVAAGFTHIHRNRFAARDQLGPRSASSLADARKRPGHSEPLYP